MGEKQPQGKESHQRGEQEVSEAEMDDQTKHTDEERWCALKHTASNCKQGTGIQYSPSTAESREINLDMTLKLRESEILAVSDSYS